MLKYTISTLFILCAALVFSQDEQQKDSVVYKQSYGLRVGLDLSKPLRALFDDNYTGFEIVGDYRISNKYYIAAELGNEKRTSDEDLYNYTTSGSYAKVGFDYNMYQNWYGMENAIHMGLRYGFGTFSQTLNSYKPFNSNTYFHTEEQAAARTAQLGEFSGLNASWLEVVIGLKAELFANIYLGASARINYLISNKEANNFSNLYIPGFQKVTTGSKFGASINYTVTYMIPFYKKKKKAVVVPDEQEK